MKTECEVAEVRDIAKQQIVDVSKKSRLNVYDMKTIEEAQIIANILDWVIE